MGNSFFCNRCNLEDFKFSQSCQSQYFPENPDKPTTEQRWMTKLQRLDEVHTQKKCLTQEGFDFVLERFEKHLFSKGQSLFCSNCADIMLDCLEKNPQCVINCHTHMMNYIDCMDKLRIERVHQRMEPDKDINCPGSFPHLIF